MKKVKIKTLTDKRFEDAWSAQKAKIEDLAHEQTSSDIALVEAQRAHATACKKLADAQARATTATKRLESFRNKLGAE